MKRRRSVRLKGYDYSRKGVYFVTICVQDKKCIFGNVSNGKMILNECGLIADKWWMNVEVRYGDVKLDACIIMPNHVHGIIEIVGAIHESPRNDDNDAEATRAGNSYGGDSYGAIRELPLRRDGIHSRRQMLLPKIVGFFKMNVSKQINQLRNASGNKLWQRNYYEHVIREEKDLNRIREYIINNPKNWKDDDLFSMGNSE